jgi:hypothetical protein
MNEMREQFGETRLVEFIKRYHHLPATDFKEKLNDEITKFTKGYPQNDDITFVVVKLEMTPVEIQQSNRLLLFQLIEEGTPLEEALESTGISMGTYLELKEKRDRFGDDALKEGEEEVEEVEIRHATHEQVKMIVQIVRQNPEFGSGRITQVLNSDEYGNQDIKESVIKRELVRMKLDTREKREAFSRRELPSWAAYT